LPLPVRVRPVLVSAALLCGASSVTGQTPPPQIGQDELDLQAQANVVLGSGARALGMGGAFLARADDATAASWNPAGLSYLRLPEISFVYSGSRLDSLDVASTSRLDSLDVASTSRTEDKRHGRTPDFFAVAYPFDLGGWNGAAQVSFQRQIAFGGERTINETSVDAETGEIASRPSDVSSAGGYDVIALATGVVLRGHFRVGATVNRWFNGYHQTLDRDTIRVGTPGHTTQSSDYDLSGWNVNLGLMWSPREEVNFGLVYKTAFTGDVALSRSRVDSLLTDTSPTTTNQASSSDDLENPVTLKIPAAVGAGVSWRPRSRLTLSADYTRTFWSKGEIRNFFVLARAEPNRPAPPPAISPSLPYPTLNSRQAQHDTVQLRGGVEFVFILGRLKWPVRAGAFGDRQYVQAANGTAPQFFGLTVGTGLVLGPVLLDVAYMRETGDYNAIDTDGTTKTTKAISVHSSRVIGSVIYRFNRH
jgi:long-subunit fatty acid transport protein